VPDPRRIGPLLVMHVAAASAALFVSDMLWRAGWVEEIRAAAAILTDDRIVDMRRGLVSRQLDVSFADIFLLEIYFTIHHFRD
jgi:hypothetical protein